MNGHTGYTGNGVDSDPVTGSAHEYDRGRQGAGTRRRSSTVRYSTNGGAATKEESPSITFDALSLLRPAAKRWYWLVLGGAMGAATGFFLGQAMWSTSYTATAQILKIESHLATDAFRPQTISGVTLVGMIQSPEVFKQLGAKMNPPISGSYLDALIDVNPERQSDIVSVSARGATPKEAVDLANQYNLAVIDFTREQQRQEAEQADVWVADELEKAQADLEAARKQLPAGESLVLDATGEPVATPGRMTDRIRAAQEELEKELITYTDNHPRVRQKRAEIAALEAQVPAHMLEEDRFSVARGAIPRAPRLGGSDGGARSEYELAYYHLQMQRQLVGMLTSRLRAIQNFKTRPPGNFKELQPASLDNVAVHDPKLKVALVAAFLGILGMVVASTELVRREIFDNRLKTEADVKRVTGLPVLATLGDLRPMSLATQETWAFRTWIALQDRLAYSPNHGLICGITSSNFGDGRSTWVNLLAGAARKCGFRVLTIATRSTSDPINYDEPAGSAAEATPEPASVGAESGAERYNGHARAAAPANGVSREMSSPTDFAPPSRSFSGESEFTSLTASALFTPAMVTEKLTGPETDPLVHIPLPGWTWNLERRKQWQGALNVWRKIDNVVILVELPPASVPESVLLASNLPNLVWLVESGKSDATSTRAQLETLRHARCNIVGAVINRALTRMTEGRFSRWVGCLAMFTMLGLCSDRLMAADQSAPAGMDVPAQFSVVSPTQRAAWQQKLTLGPGDVLNVSLYGQPLLTAEELPIGPDGRISYLEAQNVVAAGLTVDEFRDRLNQELGKFRREPQAFVVPLAYNSKKYFMLGKVTQSGVFTLDRPLTLIEAVARAKGMETGIGADRSLVELADLSRSFIARNGRHLSVDFEKLFLQGDLSQNIALEPNDYIYFPSNAQKEVYVLGAVNSPGAYMFTSSTGALGAIAARGGFTLRAWKNRVLVIRGSLGRPETFVIDAKDILTAQKADLRLQPKDIVFVSDRPWARAEELLEAATSAFVTSAVVVWTGLHVNSLPVR